jgi:GH15 family glucan-1,4-alpha-glucosidase
LKRPGGLEFRLDGHQGPRTGSAPLSEGSPVWFTVNEIYYSRVDQVCVRDIRLIVTDGDAFFAENKRDCETGVERHCHVWTCAC